MSEEAPVKLLAIVGSPRPNGNTFKIVTSIEQHLTTHYDNLNVEILQLSKVQLSQCKGCFVCIEKGESHCPIQDEREAIEAKIKMADGVIFASPVYTYNVSWIMKNFLDRFAYRCHRPDFQGKKTMVVVTTGAVGLGFVRRVLAFMLETMGFVVNAQAGVTCPPAHEIDAVKASKELRQLHIVVDRFYQSLLDAEPSKPSFVKLLSFKMQQKSFSKAPKDSADYKFWNEKKWLDPSTRYYYPAQIGGFKNAAASILCRQLAK
jgi:multimeric flavodoxin WrbA